MDNFNFQNNELAKMILSSKLEPKEQFGWSNYAIELIVRPECNQKCEYCYITKYGDQLYPKETRVSREQTLKNIEMFLEYLYEKKYFINRWELFAGDLFFDNLYFDILDLFKKYFNKIKENFSYLLEDKIVEIVTPTNFSFILSDKKNEKINKLENYIENFRQMNIILGFSWSTDGKYAVDIREKKEIPEEYWDKVFALVKKYNFGIHPMISFESINNSIKNYDWFLDKLSYFNDNQYWSPTFLEVRNSGWTDEQIQEYLKLLNHVIDFRWNKLNKNLKNFTKHIFGSSIPELGQIFSNDFIGLKSIREKSDSHPTCGMKFALNLNVSDLAFYPCHRLTYPQFEGIKFKLNENKDKIIDVEAGKNLSLFNYILDRNIHYEPLCTKCEINYICPHGCLGAQYEYSGELFLPIPEVCRMLKAKMAFLIKRYHELGVFYELFNNSQEYEDYCPQEMKKTLLNYLKKMGYEEYGKYE